MPGSIITKDLGKPDSTRIETTEDNIRSTTYTTDDGGTSKQMILKDSNIAPEIYTKPGKDSTGSVTTYGNFLYNSNNLFSREYLASHTFTDTFRFGVINPYGATFGGREYLFFTKPDLHITKMEDAGNVNTQVINPDLANYPFWVDLYNNRKYICNALQYSNSTDTGMTIKDPFNHLLSNRVSSSLDVPSLDADVVETPSNMYGVNYSYRGSSESKDDGVDFALEFKDTRYLDIFYFFKAYEEYETLKHHGTVAPCKKYIVNKILHDQFSIYKFIVDEDMETIIYWGKMIGVFPVSFPRDVFSNPIFDNGLSYSINFKAAFYEDMKPEILREFNLLNQPIYDSKVYCPYQIKPYNPVLGKVDMRPARAAYIEQVWKESKSDSGLIHDKAANYSPSGYLYKLRWRGAEKY